MVQRKRKDLKRVEERKRERREKRERKDPFGQQSF
jgi:hypothetical protein